MNGAHSTRAAGDLIWLRQAIARALAVIVSEPAARVCDHADPHVLTLWDQRLRCPACAAAHAVALRQLDPAEDHTCDRCRQQVDPVTPIVIELGPLHVALGLCATCLNDRRRHRHAAR